MRSNSYSKFSDKVISIGVAEESHSELLIEILKVEAYQKNFG